MWHVNRQNKLGHQVLKWDINGQFTGTDHIQYIYACQY